MREIFQRYSVYFGLGLVGVGALVFFYFQNQREEFSGLMEDDAILSEAVEDKKEDGEITQEEVILKVDLKGAVRNPGVYDVKEGDRVIDVVQRAGGFLDVADPNQVNLSQRVMDEMVIYVPKKGEEISPQQNVTLPQSNEKDGKININTADATTLQTLPGIGPQKADAIIRFREENGPFKKIEDLMKVSGIGEKTFEKLKEQITAQ